MKKLVVLVPTLNEYQNIQLLVPQILAQRLHGHIVEILIVDSNSTDGTQNVIKKIQKNHANVHLLQTKKPGLGYAIKIGLSAAIKKYGADHIVTMDADGSHKPRQIHRLVKTLAKSDVVLGSRYVKKGTIRNWPLHRRMLSWFGNSYLQLTLKTNKVTDFTTNFRAITSSSLSPLLEAVELLPDDWSFLTAYIALCSQHKLIIKESPITFADRKHGQSKLNSLSYSKRLLALPWRYRMSKAFNYEKSAAQNWSKQLVSA